MANKLSLMFRKLLNEYAGEYDKASADLTYRIPLNDMATHDIVAEIKSHIKDPEYVVNGSLGGKPRWARVPWFAVMNSHITTSVQKGVYIVYLINKDTKELYLTLNQGVTEINHMAKGSEKLSFTGPSINKQGKEQLKNRALEIRKIIKNNYGFSSGEIDTGNKGYDAGCIFFKKYDLESFPDDDELLFKDLNDFMLMYKGYCNDVFGENSVSPEDEEGDRMSDNGSIEMIKTYIASKGFTYEDGLIENFYLSLKSKPFVILAGTSGTGKTKLVKLFAEAIGAEYKLVPVRPDWSDSSDLFGHANIHGQFVDGAIVEFVESAMVDPEKPYFLCLDEMNLARVEYYFSDFLSLIETRKWDGDTILTDTVDLGEAGNKKHSDLCIPENLYVIGTVNMDETTYPFSKKVLDRANTIEFSDVDLVPSFTGATNDVEPDEFGNDFLKTKYLTLLTDIDSSQEALVTKVCTELQSINDILRKANAHVGYRVRDEIAFYMLNNDEFKLLKYEEAMDFEIMQKILPRIQGSSQGIKDLLTEMFMKCAGDYSSFKQDTIWSQMQNYLKSNKAVYPKSAEKICYMMRRFEEDGFTSYWL